jgi:Gas vesicle synthesis protein GvpO
MADESRTTRTKRRRPDDERQTRPSRKPKQKLSGAQLAMSARRQLSEITGLEAQAVTSLEREDDGTWRVTVELLELSRLPETDDLLGSYEAELDEDGDLQGYRRLRRYARSQKDDGLER